VICQDKFQSNFCISIYIFCVYFFKTNELYPVLKKSLQQNTTPQEFAFEYKFLVFSKDHNINQIRTLSKITCKVYTTFMILFSYDTKYQYTSTLHYPFFHLCYRTYDNTHCCSVYNMICYNTSLRLMY